MPQIQSEEDANETCKEDLCVRHKGCVGENLCTLELKGPVAHRPQFSYTTVDQRG